MGRGPLGGVAAVTGGNALISFFFPLNFQTPFSVGASSDGVRRGNNRWSLHFRFFKEHQVAKGDAHQGIFKKGKPGVGVALVFSEKNMAKGCESTAAYTYKGSYDTMW